MSWFKQYYETSGIKIERFPCNNTDCRNYGWYYIATRSEGKLRIAWFREIEMMICFSCEHFERRNCYVPYEK